MTVRRASLLAGAITMVTVGCAVPALADITPPLPGLPTATPTLVPPVAPPVVVPPTVGVPALPAVPQLPGLPRLPGAPALPRLGGQLALPALPALAPPANGARLVLVPPGAMGYFAYGGYVADGLSNAGTRVPPAARPTDQLPAPLPIDTSGQDQTNYALAAGWRSPAELAAQAVADSRRHAAGALGWLLSLVAAAGVAAGVTVLVRRRGRTTA